MRKATKWVTAGLLLGAVCGGAYAASIAFRGGTKSETRSLPLDADEVARVLNLKMYTFSVPLPVGRYSLHVWVEHWTRGAPEPEIEVLATMGTQVTAENETLTVCLPTTSHPDSYVRWGGMTAGSTPSHAIDLKKLSGWSTMEPRPVTVGQDLPLAALMVNPKKPISASTEHVEQDHDETYYLRARFDSGWLGGGTPAWKDGKVTFN